MKAPNTKSISLAKDRIYSEFLVGSKFIIIFNKLSQSLRRYQETTGVRVNKYLNY